MTFLSQQEKRADSLWLSAWKHLRVPYQLTLAPIFLWGYVLAAPVAWRIVPAFIALHFLLYPGITAYNSYYDRDTGPIGGLRNPPPVNAAVLHIGIALKSAGIVIALTIGPTFATIYAVFVVLSLLYSHPRFRWKSNPWLSAGVVGFGQGGLGFLAGWTSGRGSLVGIAESAPGLACAILTTLGMYPLTQLFQIEEDCARGDRTLSVVLGRRKALRLSQILLLLGGVAAMTTVSSVNPPIDVVIVGIGYCALLGVCEWLVRNPLTRDQTFRVITAVNYGSSAGFALLLLARVARWG